MTNVDTVTHQIEDIIKDFKSLSISGIFKGIEELGTFAAYIPVEFQQCEGIRPDIDRFSNWAKIFTHPSDLLVRLETNLPAHLNEIMVDVQAANLACDQGHYFDCGENYGEVLVLAVGQVTQTLQSIQWKKSRQKSYNEKSKSKNYINLKSQN